MGNTVARVTPAAGAAAAAAAGAGGGGQGRKIRVLLPAGEIALLDGPLDAMDLMMEHLNHMVVHCSTAGAAASTGKRAAMTIMQPHEKLEQGQSYVVHPIPSQQNKTSKFQKQQPFSIQTTNFSKISIRDDSDKGQQEKAEPRKKKTAKLSTTKRFKKKDLEVNSAGDPAQRPEQSSDAPRNLHTNDAKQVHWQDREDYANDEGEDNEGEGPVVFNLNMHMGWRPALESIPESPIGSTHQLDLMQGPPPVLCI